MWRTTNALSRARPGSRPGALHDALERRVVFGVGATHQAVPEREVQAVVRGEVLVVERMMRRGRVPTPQTAPRETGWVKLHREVAEDVAHDHETEEQEHR